MKKCGPEERIEPFHGDRLLQVGSYKKTDFIFDTEELFLLQGKVRHFSECFG